MRILLFTSNMFVCHEMSVGWELRHTMSTIPGCRDLRLSEGDSSCHSNYGKGACVVNGVGSALAGCGTQYLLCEMTSKRTQGMTNAENRGKWCQGCWGCLWPHYLCVRIQSELELLWILFSPLGMMS